MYIHIISDNDDGNDDGRSTSKTDDKTAGNDGNGKEMEFWGEFDDPVTG